MLPDGNVAIAASTGGYVRLYAASQGPRASRYVQYRLAGAHAVSWSESRNLLWVMGTSELHGLALTGTAARPALTLRYRYTLPATGAMTWLRCRAAPATAGSVRAGTSTVSRSPRARSPGPLSRPVSTAPTSRASASIRRPARSSRSGPTDRPAAPGAARRSASSTRTATTPCPRRVFTKPVGGSDTPARGGTSNRPPSGGGCLEDVRRSFHAGQVDEYRSIGPTEHTCQMSARSPSACPTRRFPAPETLSREATPTECSLRSHRWPDTRQLGSSSSENVTHLHITPAPGIS